MDTQIEHKKRFTPKQIYGGVGVTVGAVVGLIVGFAVGADVAGVGVPWSRGTSP